MPNGPVTGRTPNGESVTLFPWDAMTPEQKEYSIYMFAIMAMKDEGWPTIPKEVTERLDALEGCWDEFLNEVQ